MLACKYSFVGQKGFRKQTDEMVIWSLCLIMKKAMVIVNIVKAEGPFLGATVTQDLQTQYYNYCIFTIQQKI